MQVLLDSLNGLPKSKSQANLITIYQTNHKAMSGHVHNMAYIKLHTTLTLRKLFIIFIFFICFRASIETQGQTFLNRSMYGFEIIHLKSSQDLFMYASWDGFGLFPLLEHTQLHPCPASQRYRTTTFKQLRSPPSCSQLVVCDQHTGKETKFP